MRAFVDQLSSEVRPTTVAHVIYNLCYAARLIAPKGDWRWLAAIKARLTARARPLDRFDRLVPPLQILDFGIELMDEALNLPNDGHGRERSNIVTGSFWSSSASGTFAGEASPPSR